MVQIDKPDGGQTKYTYTDTASCSSQNPTTPYVTIEEKLTASTSRSYRGTVDTMGRLKETREIDPGGDITQARGFYASGLLQNVDQPHHDGGSPYPTVYNYTGSFLSSVVPAQGGTIGYSYNANTKTITNTDGRKRKYTYQEDGRVSQVLEEDSAGQLTVATNYSYDAMGRLQTITQGVQTRSFTYDSIGRLASETYPESGATSYTYDNNSNTLTKTDARGIVTTFTYDELNRVTLKTYSDGTPSVSYSYDSQPSGSPITTYNPVGRLTKVTTTTSGVTVSHYYSYCTCSAVDREATVITDGTTKTYTTSYTYNLAGAIMSITYPNGKVVTYTRDGKGRETKVSSRIGSQNIDYIEQATYGGPRGELTGMTHPIHYSYGASVSSGIGYDPATLRITGCYSLGMDLSFKYRVPNMGATENGHIYDIVDNYNASNSQHFEYDRWYRLTGYWRSNARTDPYSIKLTWVYDQYGNITSATREYPPQSPYTSNYGVNASTNRLTGSSYDAAGNMTARGTFDAENRLTSTTGFNYLYDGHSRRLRKLENGKKTYFVYSITGRMLVEDNWTTAVTRNQIYFAGQMIATHDQADTVRLYFKDHLGSMRSVVTVPPGANWGDTWTTDEVYDYNPYGDLRSSYIYVQDPTTRLFTGKERDGGFSGSLDYFGARYYHSGFSMSDEAQRWISPDPVTDHIYDPESLNKYSYVRNDPVNLIDPDGRQARRPGCYWGTIYSEGSVAGVYMYGNCDSLSDWGEETGGGAAPDPAGIDRPPASQRANWVNQAKESGLADRAKGDCGNFLAGIIANLARLPKGFTVAKLLENIGNANINPTGLSETQIANTRNWNTINLGGNAYVTGDYGRDLLSTLFHEGFHLKSSGGSGGVGIPESLADEQELATAAAKAMGFDPDNNASLARQLSNNPSEKSKEFFGQKCGGGWSP